MEQFSAARVTSDRQISTSDGRLQSLSGMEGLPETDLVDYSEDPLEGQVLFTNPISAPPGFVPPLSDITGAQNILPVISLPDPFSSGLVAPPLSPGTASFLASHLLDPADLDQIPSPPPAPEVPRTNVTNPPPGFWGKTLRRLQHPGS